LTELTARTLREFTSDLASDTPAPGGGSAAAAAGALGAALLRMVVGLTVGKEKYRDAWEELAPVGETAAEVEKRLLELVDEDTRAFDAVVAARRLPKESPQEKEARSQAIASATVLAATVPMQTAFFAERALRAARAALERGNPNTASDAWAAGLLLSAAVRAALANVRINLPGVGDAELARGFREDAAELERKSAESLAQLGEAALAKGL